MRGSIHNEVRVDLPFSHRARHVASWKRASVSVDREEFCT